MCRCGRGPSARVVLLKTAWGESDMTRVRSSFRSAAALVAILALVALAPGAAPAGTNDSANLEVLNGETLYLDGIHAYSNAVVIRTGGTLLTNGTHTLELRAPSITVESGAVVASTRADGGGGTIRLRCDSLVVAGTVSVAGGPGASYPPSGRNGGTLDIRADKTTTLSGGLYAGGGSCAMPAYANGNGGHGGTLDLTSPVLTCTGAAVASVEGGDGGPGQGSGGTGGSISLRAGTLAASGWLYAQGGDGGHTTGSEESFGGHGGTIRVDHAYQTGGWFGMWVQGGLGENMYGSYPAAPGTSAEVIAAYAPYASGNSLNGWAVDPEYARS